MKTTGGSDGAKRRAGESAAALVEPGMTVGLGTGSTAAHAIRRLGERVADGLDIEGVPTSFDSRQRARDAGIPLRALEDVDTIDLAIDGADQVADFALVKGGGAAHAREKLVDTAAERFVVVVDSSKQADVLSHPVPVEVLPVAHSVVAGTVRDAGGEPSLRRADRKDGPVVTDNGNLVLDCEFGDIAEPTALARTLSEMPGVVEHGLFVGSADEVHVGTDSGVRVLERE
ncbi:ribose 5-phosphate isomerase A [Salinigranum rubrum]|uniref:Ribose-5-phosphate isomerase A n=1 Tax=Salinigranum rubrum TaxID=755307 RepID=A0A2I8VNC1_9EURY|nr:ribose-5-phosphate isomerase RpiA [Salinigranum rubrum]AUV83426.1 ribose 5-phosphate isomerase A [Salinigranum rubrum]